MTQLPVVHSNTEFIPTEAQKAVVSINKAFGMKEELIRKLILNPSTQKPISKATFAKAFAFELKTSKAALNFKANNALVVMLDSPNEKIKLKAAMLVKNLCSKGVYEEKFKLDYKLPFEDQINQVMEALRTRKINTFECDAFLKAIEAKRQTKAAGDPTAGIVINVDGETVDIMREAAKPADDE